MDLKKPMVNHFPFLVQEGEMGDLIRNFEWKKTPLGDPEDWPVALKISVGIMLNSPFPMHISWGDDFIQFYNDAYRSLLLQVGRPEGLALPVSESYPEVWNVIAPILAGVMTGVPVRLTDFQICFEDEGVGRDYYFDFFHSPILNERGKVVGVLTKVLETTDTVMTYLELEKLQSEFEAIQDKYKLQKERFIQFLMQAPAGVCILGGNEFVFEIVNPVYQALFPGRELLGKPVLEAIPELIEDPILDILNGVMKLGKTFRALDRLIPMARTTDGAIEDRYFDLTYQARFDDHGTPNGILVYVTEVTDRKKRELRSQDFIEIVSKEIKTPLSSLTTEIQHAGLRLRNFTSSDEFLTGAIDRADGHVKRLAQLINAYLNVSSVKSGSLNLNIISFDLNDEINDLIEQMKLSAPIHIFRFNPIGTNFVKADRSKIRSVLDNLFISAIKYSPAGGDIFIECKVVGNFTEIVVRDTGLGIRANDLEKIFQYLNEEIIEAHGGRIWVQRTPGKDSSFHFSLPT